MHATRFFLFAGLTVEPLKSHCVKVAQQIADDYICSIAKTTRVAARRDVDAIGAARFDCHTRENCSIRGRK